MQQTYAAISPESSVGYWLMASILCLALADFPGGSGMRHSQKREVYDD